MEEIELKHKCENCENQSVWIYMPNGEEFCDNCVPRGCSCNSEPIDDDYENENPENWVERKDEFGRLLPCCEYEKL